MFGRTLFGMCVPVCVRPTHTNTQRVPVTTDRSSYCMVPLLRGWTRLWRARGGRRTTERKVRRGNKACNQNVNYIKMSRRSDQSERPDDGLERRSNRQKSNLTCYEYFRTLITRQMWAIIRGNLDDHGIVIALRYNWSKIAWQLLDIPKLRKFLED